jgi:hypothetical protein
VPFRFVLNGARFRSRLAEQAVAALWERGNLLWPPVHERVAVAKAMAEGRAAPMPKPTGAAARGLVALWSGMREELEAKSGRHRASPFPARRFT